MIKKLAFLMFLVASSAYGSDFTDGLSKMILEGQCETAKSAVQAEYSTRSLGANYWPTMKAVNNVCIFLRTYEKMGTSLALKRDTRGVNEYYNQEVRSSIAMLSEQPLPFTQAVIDLINDKIKSADEKVNARNGEILAEREEEKRRVAEARQKEIERREDANHDLQASIEQSEAERQIEREKREDAEKIERLKEQERQEAVRSLHSKVETCHKQRPYSLFNSQESIIDLYEQLAGWQDNQRNEKRITQQTGVINLTEQYNNGAWIIKTGDIIKEEFGIYKKLGGKAASSKMVKHSLKNPCSALEADLDHAEHDGPTLPK